MAVLQCLVQFRASFQRRISMVLRALGLNILVCWIRSLKSRRCKQKIRIELPKMAICYNRPSALLRALIHVVPVAAALSLVTVNLFQYYIGSSIQSLALYQAIAKIHEIMMQASLAAVVFSYIRHELVLGQGIPLGALFSGLQLSQISYLWSMEFWGSIRSKHLTLRKRCSLIAVIIGGISLAAVVGPSSAILLVPRLAYWPAGSTHIWINVTSDDLWPTRTNQILVPPNCLLVHQQAQPWSCPSDEWQSIETYLQLVNDALPAPYEEVYGNPAPGQVQVTGKGSIRQLGIQRQLWEPFVNSDSETAIATAPQAAVADALTATGTLWSFAAVNVSTDGHGLIREQLDAEHRISSNYYQPYTIASCANDSIQGHSDERPLAFPIPPGVLAQNLPQLQINNSLLSMPSFDLQGFTRSELLEATEPSWENRLRWIELPANPFNGSAIGAAVLLPAQTLESGEPRYQEILVCTLGAGWGASTVNTSTQEFGSTFVRSSISDAQSVIRDIESYKSMEPPPLLSTAESLAETSSGIFILPAYPQRLINISTNWSQYLNPFVAEINTTVFHQLMQGNLTLHSPRVSAGIILSSLLTNGLARIGIESSLQGSQRMVNDSNGDSVVDSNYWFQGRGDAFIVDPNESKDWVKLEVRSTFEGYAYNTAGAGPKVAIVFLLIYCTFAIAHTLYAGFTGISSTCWDSIGEVTALAMNSTPTSLLRNTSSGILDSKIYKLPARVFARPDDEGEGEHLELVLGEQDEKTVEQQTLKVNRVYG